MKHFSLIVLCAALVSCTPFEDFPEADYVFGGGAILVNEGNFNSGNGSLSFYSYDSLNIYNDLYYSVNGRPLGDVPNSVVHFQGKLYVVVNNSGKIEVINPVTFKSEGSIPGLISPRNIGIISNYKAYVTSLWSDSVTIIDLGNNKISGYVNVRRSSEAIVVAGNRAYVSNWMGGNEIMVINTLTDEVLDSIVVGREPESMAIDKFLRLWVLCTGGWEKLTNAELDLIDLSSHSILKNYIFPSAQNSPSCLRIDGFGQKLYYLDNGVQQMDVSSQSLPVTPLIPQTDGYFYKLGINPVNSDIFITDAVDYVHNGYLHIYKNDGSFVSKHETGIIPGEICFRITINK